MKLLSTMLAILCLPVMGQSQAAYDTEPMFALIDRVADSEPGISLTTPETTGTPSSTTKHVRSSLKFTTNKKVNAVYVYDTDGNLVQSANGNNGNAQLDVRSLANGTYYMHVLCDGEKRIEEFVKR